MESCCRVLPLAPVCGPGRAGRRCLSPLRLAFLLTLQWQLAALAALSPRHLPGLGISSSLSVGSGSLSWWVSLHRLLTSMGNFCDSWPTSWGSAASPCRHLQESMGTGHWMLCGLCCPSMATSWLSHGGSRVSRRQAQVCPGGLCPCSTAASGGPWAPRGVLQSPVGTQGLRLASPLGQVVSGSWWGTFSELPSPVCK